MSTPSKPAPRPSAAVPAPKGGKGSPPPAEGGRTPGKPAPVIVLGARITTEIARLEGTGEIDHLAGSELCEALRRLGLEHPGLTETAVINVIRHALNVDAGSWYDRIIDVLTRRESEPLQVIRLRGANVPVIDGFGGL